MFKMTQKIYNTLKQERNTLKEEGIDLEIFVEDDDSFGVVCLQPKIRDDNSYVIRFISRDDSNDVAVRVYGLLNIDIAHRIKMLPVINELNEKYRYIKFVLDEDGDVNLEHDFPTNCPDPSASAVEIVVRLDSVIDAVRPELMQALWA